MSPGKLDYYVVIVDEDGDVAADEAFARSKQLLESAVGADPDLLDASLLPDLEASLRREQHRFAEALQLIDQAREESSGGAAAGRRSRANLFHPSRAHQLPQQLHTAAGGQP